MANADQILSLIRNHLNNDDAQFRKVALQISAVEAKNGHAVLARTIQELLSQKKTSFSNLKIIPLYRVSSESSRCGSFGGTFPA